MFIKPVTIGSTAFGQAQQQETNLADEGSNKGDPANAAAAASAAEHQTGELDFEEHNAQAAARIIEAGANMRGSLLNVRA